MCTISRFNLQQVLFVLELHAVLDFQVCLFLLARHVLHPVLQVQLVLFLQLNQQGHQVHVVQVLQVDHALQEIQLVHLGLVDLRNRSEIVRQTFWVTKKLVFLIHINMMYIPGEPG